MSLPKVSIWSQFRNAAGPQIALYRRQIESLDYPPDLLRIYPCEGDSKDETLAELGTWAMEDYRVRVIKHDTGIPHFSHSPRRERMKAVSENGNRGWDIIAEAGWGDYALMIESDLLFQPNLLKRMIERFPVEAGIFAPMIWIQVNGDLRFYDIWAYRSEGGKMFLPNSPLWYYRKYEESIFELESVGSTVLFRMKLIADGLRLGEADCVLGMCNEARRRGYKVYCDAGTHVLHPQIQGVT